MIYILSYINEPKYGGKCSMYHILIVDDEKFERDCIRYLIESSNLPLEVAEADDGTTALALLQESPVDILFTDVQMPVMDGLELIRRSNEILPGLKLIIFSSYADFEYARTAITLGVENYILKPVVSEELINTLTSLVRQLDEEQDSRKQQNRQQIFLLQYALQRAISGNFPYEDADSATVEQLDTFQLMVLVDFNTPFLQKNYSLFYDALRDQLLPGMESLNPAPNQALLFLRTIPKSTCFWENTFLPFVHSHFQTECYVSISRPLSQYPSLQDAFNAVEQQMEQRFWMPKEKIFTPSSESTNPHSLENVDDNQQISLIKSALSIKNAEAFQKNLDILFQKYRLSANQSQIYVKFIFSNLLTIIYPYLPETYSSSAGTLDGLISQIYLQKDITEIMALIQELADQVTASFSDNIDSVRREIVLLKEYIQGNYSKDLSVENLASIVYLTPDYLSRLFKKATGKSLSQYIRQYRMEKARELLLQTNKKVIQIGIDVGYSNYSYFCQSFREYFGISPEKYRQGNAL